MQLLCENGYFVLGLIQSPLKSMQWLPLISMGYTLDPKSGLGELGAPVLLMKPCLDPGREVCGLRWTDWVLKEEPGDKTGEGSDRSVCQQHDRGDTDWWRDPCEDWHLEPHCNTVITGTCQELKRSEDVHTGEGCVSLGERRPSVGLCLQTEKLAAPNSQDSRSEGHSSSLQRWPGKAKGWHGFKGTLEVSPLEGTGRLWDPEETPLMARRPLIRGTGGAVTSMKGRPEGGVLANCS